MESENGNEIVEVSDVEEVTSKWIKDTTINESNAIPTT